MNAPPTIGRLKEALRRVRHRGFHALSTFPGALAPGETISDQFLYRGDIAANRFVAENTVALVAGEPVEVTHRLLFFDPDGRSLGEQSVDSSRFYTTITIDPLPVDFATYVHATAYRKPSTLQRHHRGYSLYQRTSQSVFAAVHGNFGGIVTDPSRSPRRHRLLARHRAHFLYTPQHRFHPDEQVTLYVMNPCPTTETVEVLQTAPGVGGHRRGPALTVPSLGVRCCRLEGLDGYLTLRSRLPTCRPLIFVEKESHLHHFDVFHT
ncbi:MAG: hypothetical protein VKI81_09490 [Synechococcaceae cyanobacterium]|nr:hypothetical protein [Synechococcaceae cyanobacterium]